jgi:hypothetical protein
MPFPANWLEELIVEWLDLEGFASTLAENVVPPTWLFPVLREENQVHANYR